MAFTFNQYKPSGPEEYPFKDMISNAMHTYTQGVNAHYLPQSIQAKNFGNMMGPLSTLAASPFYATLNKTQKEGINNLISQSLRSYQQSGGGQQGMQQGGSQGSSLFDRISHLFGGHSQQEGGQDQGMWQGGNPYAPQMTPHGMEGNMDGTPGSPDRYSNKGPLSPQDIQAAIQNNPNYNGGNKLAVGAGNEAGIEGQIAQGFATSKAPAGSINTLPSGEVVSAPAGGVVERNQKVIGTIKNIQPILKNIIKESKPFLEPGGTLKLISGTVRGSAEKLGTPEKYLNILPGKGYPSKKAQFDSDITKVTEQLMGAYALPTSDQTTKMVNTILTPHPGETYKGYEGRIIREMGDLSQRAQNATQQLGNGFSLNGQGQRNAPQQQETQAPQMSLPVGGEQESPPRSAAEKEARDNESRQQAEDEAAIFNTTPEIILEAQSKGINSAKGLREFIKKRGRNGK